MAFKFKYEEYKKLPRRADRYGQKLDTAINNYLEASAKNMEAQAKKNAKWKDQTTLSRTTITARLEKTATSYKIVLTGNTAHFIFLELANNKKYAILKPQLLKDSPRVIETLNRIVSKVEF